MKHLIVTCDGTWNTADERQNDIPAPTNVVRLYNALADDTKDGVEQRAYYHPGVGTDGNVLQKLAGGAYGAGISANIMSAYRWLADNYAAGDRMWLFGFSRGAFTARSLAGFIGACGLPKLAGLSPSDTWAAIQSAYDRYRTPKDQRKPITWPVLSAEDGTTVIPIHFVGVWDTVGALGIPDDLVLLNLIDDPKKWSFHDTQLGDHVRFARHAVAIDEMRASFTPTFWTDDKDQPLNDGNRVRQLWFPGVHCDVGGGYASCGLSDGALQWMIEEAQAQGLAFEKEFCDQIAPDFRGVLHDSVSGAFAALKTRPRARPKIAAGSPVYHGSAVDREARPPITQSPYHEPTVTLAVGETSDPIEIYARNHWNPTGIFLEEGASYEFRATGEWIDGSIPSDASGRRDGQFHLGEMMQLIGTAVGKLEAVYQKATGNTSADIIGTRRIESEAWFALMGAIANDGPNGMRNPQPDGSPYPHQTFRIGNGPTPLTVGPTEAGYLWAFANDAWHFYGNNRGSVALTVKRTA